MQKPPLSFWRIWNLGFGLLGVQFGWSLLTNHLSTVYQLPGAQDGQFTKLWVAAPLTGLLVQPIIGALSDRAWGPLGRRRPYLLAGAVLGSLALLLPPGAGSLFVAAGLLWVLNACVNVGQVSFRALAADQLPESQRTRGFATQSAFIGLGAVAAEALPWVLAHRFSVSEVEPAHRLIPPVNRCTFYLGAAAFLLAVLYTVVTTREHPPEDPDEFRRQRARRGGPAHRVREILDVLGDMPPVMQRLAAVQFFTWLGLFCMWIYLGPAIARNAFGAVDAQSAAYQDGLAWNRLLGFAYLVVGFVAALVLVVVGSRANPRFIHTVCLLCGAAGLLSVGVAHNKYLLFLSMVGVGTAWASILSMPYALLAGVIPAERAGVYLGVFNCFIVLPEIVAGATFDWTVRTVLHSPVYAVVAGGAFLLVAAILMQAVPVGPEPITARADEDDIQPVADETILPA